MFHLCIFFFIAILFFILTPGILVTIPKKSSKTVVALVHALVFAIVLHFTHKIVFHGNERFADSTAADKDYLAALAKTEAADKAAKFAKTNADAALAKAVAASKTATDMIVISNSKYADAAKAYASINTNTSNFIKAADLAKADASAALTRSDNAAKDAAAAKANSDAKYAALKSAMSAVTMPTGNMSTGNMSVAMPAATVKAPPIMPASTPASTSIATAKAAPAMPFATPIATAKAAPAMPPSMPPAAMPAAMPAATPVATPFVIPNDKLPFNIISILNKYITDPNIKQDLIQGIQNSIPPGSSMPSADSMTKVIYSIKNPMLKMQAAYEMRFSFPNYVSQIMMAAYSPAPMQPYPL
jgi:hypothetical protein